MATEAEHASTSPLDSKSSHSLTAHFSLWIAKGLDCCVSISCAHDPASIGSTHGRFDFRCYNYFSFSTV